MRAIIAVLLLLAGVEAYTTYDTGAGIVYKLRVTQDTWIESSTRNYNYYGFMIAGYHPQYPKKRFLIQFESLPSACSHVEWAKMYLYFILAYKTSWHTPAQAPYISRTLQVHQVQKEWDETQTTSLYRLTGNQWSQQYLALDGTDASPHALDDVTLFTARPPGFMEFDITEAVRNWQAGDDNYGVLVWATNENDAGRDLRFASKSNSDTTRHGFVNVLCT